MSQLQFKTIDLKDFKNEDGEFTGYCSVYGVVDRANEIVAKGSFINLNEFLTDGFVAIGHDWDSLPIASIKAWDDDDYGLKVTVDFHSTPKAQEARQFVLERLERGKSVSLSIGYRVLADEYNTEGIRILKSIELFEFSVVNVPANPKAVIVSSKSFSDEASQLLADLSSFVTRAKELETLRANDNRLIGEKAISEITSVKEAVESALSDLSTLITTQKLKGKASIDSVLLAKTELQRLKAKQLRG